MLRLQRKSRKGCGQSLQRAQQSSPPHCKSCSCCSPRSAQCPSQQSLWDSRDSHLECRKAVIQEITGFWATAVIFSLFMTRGNDVGGVTVEESAVGLCWQRNETMVQTKWRVSLAMDSIGVLQWVSKLVCEWMSDSLCHSFFFPSVCVCVCMCECSIFESTNNVYLSVYICVCICVGCLCVM